VRLQQGSTLRSHWQIVERLLAHRLRTGADAVRLRFWIELADALDSPMCLRVTLRFVSHPSVEVRIAAARAFGKCFLPETVTALHLMLRDRDWRIRAQAARSMGALGAVSAVNALAVAMTDESWWVRYRAALALAALEEAGRQVLQNMLESPDEFARDMALFIVGLPEGSRFELNAA
ncbi:MAG: HEAT repeat domain-containing protein, partial [Gemmatimonadaceae bacterium]|nr:HEAT repeat domain-containing protein [Gemmatimonadaceae bacterium]